MNVCILEMAQNMRTTAVMDTKRGWNFSAFQSVREEFDALAKNYGDKGDLGTLACLMVLSLTPDQRREMLRALALAEGETKFDGTIIDHLPKHWTKPLTISPRQLGEAAARRREDRAFDLEVRDKKRGKGAGGA